MGLESAIEKLDKYFKRLEKGRARKIKPDHVEKIILKLETKAALLRSEHAETDNGSRKRRLERKLKLFEEQQDRARWLLDKISAP